MIWDNRNIHLMARNIFLISMSHTILETAIDSDKNLALKQIAMVITRLEGAKSTLTSLLARNQIGISKETIVLIVLLTNVPIHRKCIIIDPMIRKRPVGVIPRALKNEITTTSITEKGHPKNNHTLTPLDHPGILMKK